MSPFCYFAFLNFFPKYVSLRKNNEIEEGGVLHCTKHIQSLIDNWQPAATKTFRAASKLSFAEASYRIMDSTEISIALQLLWRLGCIETLRPTVEILALHPVHHHNQHFGIINIILSSSSSPSSLASSSSSSSYPSSSPSPSSSSPSSDLQPLLVSDFAQASHCQPLSAPFCHLPPSHRHFHIKLLY